MLGLKQMDLYILQRETVQAVADAVGGAACITESTVSTSSTQQLHDKQPRHKVKSWFEFEYKE